MSVWNGKGGAGTGGSPEYVHVDASAAGAGSSSTSGATDKSGSTRERVVEQKAKTANSSSQRRGSSQTGSSSSTSSTNWQAIINRLTDHTIPEDQAAIRRLGDDVRKAGANGARAVVEALRNRILDKNSTSDTRIRSIGVARILAQRTTSGGDAQRLIAAPPFINALRSVSSDPNVRASLKTWASQIRIGDPNDATELAPVTGLDEHLAQAGESTAQSASRRPPASAPGTTSFQGRPHLATTEEEADEDIREGHPGPRAPVEPFSAPMPGGFGLDGSAFDANGSVVGGPPGSVREFPASSIQPIPPHLLVPPPGTGVGINVGGMRPGWGEEEEGVQSDAPSTRSKRTSATARSRQQPIQSAFAGATPSMDGGREARNRLKEQGTHREPVRSPASSLLLDGTLSEPDSPSSYGRPIPAPITGDIRAHPQRMPPQPVVRGHQPSVSPNRFRSRSPSPMGVAQSHRMSRSRAQSRRRPTAGADPASVLINLAGVQFVRVTQAYFAAHDDELTLREGEVLAVIRREEDGRYWLGHSQGQVGRFPMQVVELLSYQARGQGDSAAQEEKTAELLRRSREIEDFMDQLHDFDITRYCITEDADVQTDLASLLGLRNEIVRHLDETTTGIGRLKAMLNKIKEAQRVHDRMIDSRIAGYAARTALHDATPRINYQELPNNPAFQYTPFDMSQYVRRTAAPLAQQIEQAPARPSIAPRTYGEQRGAYADPAATIRYRPVQEMGYAPRPAPGMAARARTYSYTPATPTRGSPEESSAYVTTEPSTPGEAISGQAAQPPMGPGGPAAAMNSRYAFPAQQQHDMGPNGGGGWGERERVPGKDEVGPVPGPTRARGGSHIASESSAHTHASRRGAF